MMIDAAVKVRVTDLSFSSASKVVKIAKRGNNSNYSKANNQTTGCKKSENIDIAKEY